MVEDLAAAFLGQLLFSMPIEAKKRVLGGDSKEATVVDSRCFIRPNAVLLGYDVTLGDLCERYCSEELANLSSEELVVTDAGVFESRNREAPRRS